MATLDTSTSATELLDRLGVDPALVTEGDLDWFVTALDATLEEAQKLPRATARFVLRAARASVKS